MSTGTKATAEDAATLAVLNERLKSAVKSEQERGVIGPMRAFVLVDAPRLAGIASRGLVARLAFDGLAIRAAAVRELHAPEDIGGGLVLCQACSTWLFVLWPCPTLQLLDGLDAP